MLMFAMERREPVAQLVEHLTFNPVVAGSTPAGLTICYDIPSGSDACNVTRQQGSVRETLPHVFWVTATNGVGAP